MQWITPKPSLRKKLKKSPYVQWLWNFLGFRFIYHKFVPSHPSDPPKRPPSTGFLWFVGIYVAIFGIASQRYENRIDRIESRTNGIYAQLGSKNWKQALERIPEAQGMVRPEKPDLFNPYMVFCSFICNHVPDQETVVSLINLIVSSKDDLSEIDLTDVDIRGADLSGVVDLNQDQLDSAVVNKETKLPNRLELKLSERRKGLKKFLFRTNMNYELYFPLGEDDEGVSPK